MDDTEDNRIYKVVVNHEEQYSIWFADREPPLGWKEVGVTGPKAVCLAHIKEVWTDMRPLSLRKKWKRMRKRNERIATSRVIQDLKIKRLGSERHSGKRGRYDKAQLQRL